MDNNPANGANGAQVNEQNNALVMKPKDGSMAVFGSMENFESAQRMAKCLAASKMIPTNYQNNIADCLIALDMSNRMGANPIMVMQNLCIIHGNPSWSSKFLIATMNACGKFSPIRYKMTGNTADDTYGCIAMAIDKATGDVLEGPEVTIGISKKEGWYQKPGSKWQTIPELMLRYRAAAFFQRLYAPEISMGLMTQEEVEDIDGQQQPGKIIDASAQAALFEAAEQVK